MNHSPQPKGHSEENGEQKGWKDLWELLSQCWKGLPVQFSTESHEKIANGSSNTKTLQGNGYCWDATTNVLLIQSWDKVFGRAPRIQPKGHMEKTEYFIYLEKMQQKLANILLHIISRSYTSAGRGRKKEDGHSSIHLPRINIQIAEPEDQRNETVLSDFNEFVRTFNLLEEENDGDHQYNSPFDSRSFVEEDSPDSSEDHPDHRLVYSGANFKEKVNTRDPYTWSEVIYGTKYPLLKKRDLNIRKIDQRIVKWLNVHKLSKETVAAIMEAEINPNSEISPKVFNELKDHSALKKSLIRDQKMTWFELMRIINAKLN